MEPRPASTASTRNRASPVGAVVAIAAGTLAGAWTAVLGWRVPDAWMGSVAVLGLGGLLALSTRSSPVRVSRRGWVLLAVAAAVVGQGLAPELPAQASVPRGVARVEGVVERGGGDGVVLVITGGSTLEGASLPADARVLLREVDAPTGTRLRVLARLSPRDEYRNPSPHPRWPSPTLAATGRARSRVEILERASFWERGSHAIRSHVRAALRATLEPMAATLGRTLLLGESHALDAASRETVRGAGLSHVLAVSGLHVTLIAGACVVFASLLLARIRAVTARADARRWAKLVGIPVALGYALLVGDAPSAWRAAVTASLAWGLAVGGRRAHPLGVAAGAALILAALRPDDLARPGFALSIVATAAIVSDLGPRREPWQAALTIAARTTCATAPIVVWIFGALPIVGLLANLVVVPLATAVLLPVLVLHAALASVSLELASVSAPAANAATRAFIAASEVFAAVPIGQGLPPPSVPQGLVLAIACGAFLGVRSWRTRGLVLVAASLALVGAEVHLRVTERPTGVVRVTFLDVGQGDAALVDLPDGSLMVIDAGGSVGGGLDPGARVLVPLLRARRRSRIDVLVLSHPHPDHYGGIAALLDAFEVGEIWDSGQANAEEPDGSIARRLRTAGAPIRGPQELCGRPRRFGAAVVRVRWPCPDFSSGWDANENSLVLDLVMGTRRFLFAGDAEAYTEASLFAMNLGVVDVLKVAHHGSRTSSELRFLRALRPEVAIVSAGRHNRYGHPHPEVWDRLVAESCCALRTDRDGGVVVTTNGRDLDLTARRCNQRCRAER